MASEGVVVEGFDPALAGFRALWSAIRRDGEGWSAREALDRCWASGVISRKTVSRGPVLAVWLSRPQLHGVNAASRRRANFFDHADGPKRLEEIATLRLAKKGPLPCWQMFHRGAVPQNHIPVEKCNAPHRFLQDRDGHVQAHSVLRKHHNHIPNLYIVH